VLSSINAVIVAIDCNVDGCVAVCGRYSYRDESSTAQETDLEFAVNDNNRALWEVCAIDHPLWSLAMRL
jgi:hypothetical protein